MLAATFELEIRTIPVLLYYLVFFSGYKKSSAAGSYSESQPVLAARECIMRPTAAYVRSVD